MAGKYLLPKLTETVETRSERVWENKEDIYDFLLQYLEMEYEPTESVFDGGSNALPHPFEQMLVFNRAFFDEEDSEHKRAILEWRAVFILMALKRIKNIKLDLVKVDLAGSSSNLFLKMMADFKPEDEVVFFKTTWDFTYVLLLDKEPIALFSPLTIVCPSKMFKKRISALKEWITIDKINNEEKLLLFFEGKQNEYGYIVQWMKDLESNLTLYRQGNSETTNKEEAVKNEINNMIDEYSRETTQNFTILFKKGIYDNINHNIRKEYDFLNVCCYFECGNKNLDFLANKYQEDIFCEKLLLLVYDDRPDTMLIRENITRLHQLVNRVMAVRGRELISVMDSGGGEMPFFAFLPFKQSFVKELVSRNISTRELFEENPFTYIRERNIIRVTMTVKGFPFSFSKEYVVDESRKVYAKDMASIYFWSPKIIEKGDWQTYYAYVSQSNANVKIDIACSEVSGRRYELKNPNSGNWEEFQIFQSSKFPEYIEITCGAVTGYLPVMPQVESRKSNGATANIYMDVGHSSTYVTIMKTQKGKKVERIYFQKPESLWIIQNFEGDASVQYNFVSPESGKGTKKDELIKGYFKNILNYFDFMYQTNEYSMEPFKDGQVLFTNAFHLNGLEKSIVSFINMEYVSLEESSRRQVHIFLEQIVMHAVWTAMMAGCDYFSIRFLHKEDMGSTPLGEIKGLWGDIQNKIMKRTGVSKPVEGKGTDCCREYEALAYNVYHKLVDKGADYEHPVTADGRFYIGVDIGWKKTSVVNINEAKDKKVFVDYVLLDFAGRDISAVNKEIKFKTYKNILSTLLSEPYKLDEGDNQEVNWLLHEFDKLYGDENKNALYNYGLFDLIAMRIETEDFKIFPDIYNHKMEFESYIRMLTFNMSLLFFEVGLFTGKSCVDKGKEINIYLSGNGAKFLSWIANLKKTGKLQKKIATRCLLLNRNKQLWKR